jgi:hypothetical protein
MHLSLTTPTLLLLHEGGWDEVLMVAVGLVAAYLVIVWTGRRARNAEDDEDEDDLAEASADEQIRPN